jgi:hypothetical protein
LIIAEKNKLKGFGGKNKQVDSKMEREWLWKENKKKVENTGLTWSGVWQSRSNCFWLFWWSRLVACLQGGSQSWLTRTSWPHLMLIQDKELRFLTGYAVELMTVLAVRLIA